MKDRRKRKAVGALVPLKGRIEVSEKHASWYSLVTTWWRCWQDTALVGSSPNRGGYILGMCKNIPEENIRISISI